MSRRRHCSPLVYPPIQSVIKNLAHLHTCIHTGLSVQCEVIAIENYLFTLLTDVFESTHNRLRSKVEARCRKLVDRWAENATSAHKRLLRAGETAWTTEYRDPHRLLVVKQGFLDVEFKKTGVEGPEGAVIRRYGPGTYIYTKEVPGLHGKGERKEAVQHIKSLTDSHIIEIPARAFEEFLKYVT